MTQNNPQNPTKSEVVSTTPLLDEDLQKLVQLTRMTLCDEERQRLKQDLATILAYTHSLDRLPLANVEPTTHPVAMKQTKRPDDVRASLPIAKVFANAPDRLGDGFGVPQVIE